MSDAKPSLRLVSANGGRVSAITGGEAREKSAITEADQVVESIDSFLQDERRALELCLDEETGYVLVKVMDWDKGTLIRQIPFEQAVRLLAKLYGRLANRAKPL